MISGENTPLDCGSSSRHAGTRSLPGIKPLAPRIPTKRERGLPSSDRRPGHRC